jgi:cysteine-rich repeat protein
MDAAAPGGAIALVGEHLHSRVGGGGKVGAAYVFTADEQGVFRQVSQLRAGDGLNCDLFGTSVAISGATALVGASQQDIFNACPRMAGPGAAYIFTQDADGRWLQTIKLTPSDGQVASAFGKSVAIEGNIAVVGAPTDAEQDRQSRGAAYVFSKDQRGEWSQLQKIRPERDEEVMRFGYAVALSGDTLVIGAPQSNVGQFENAGASLVFRRIADGTFVRTDRVTAPNGRVSDRFGEAVAVSGAVAVVGRFQHNMRGDMGDNAGGVDLYFLDKPVCHGESDSARAGCVCIPGAHGDNCLERSLCGDAVLDEAEQCDDGNENDGDGCDARCDREDCGAFGSPYGRPLLQTPAQRGALLVPDPNGTFAVMTSREVLLPRRFVHESQADFEVWNDLNVLVDPTDEDASNPDFPEMVGIGGLLKVSNAVYLSSYYANRVWYVSSLLEPHFFDLGAEALAEDPDMTKPIVRVEDSTIIGSGADLYGFDQSELPRDGRVMPPLPWPENTPPILGTIRQLQGVDIRGDASPELVGFARGSNGQGTFFAISLAFEPGLAPQVSATVTGTPPCPGGASNVTDVSVLLRDPPMIAVACKSTEEVPASVRFAEITFPNELNSDQWLEGAVWSTYNFGDGELHIDAGFIDDDAEPDLVVAIEDPLACRGVARVMFNPATEVPVALSPPITLGSLPRDVLVKDTDGDGRDEFIIVSHGDPNRPCGDALLRNQVDVFSHRPAADAAPRDGRGDVCVQRDAPDVDCPDMSCD